jgi:excisionase family DNA binding protein
MSSPAHQHSSALTLLSGVKVLERGTPNEKSPCARTQAQIKASETWQNELWVRWPREENWPAKLDIYEAAAYLRVSPDTIRRALIVARDGRARLAHQRLGATYRIRKADLDVFGAVAGRSVAA